MRRLGYGCPWRAFFNFWSRRNWICWGSLVYIYFIDMRRWKTRESEVLTSCPRKAHCLEIRLSSSHDDFCLEFWYARFSLNRHNFLHISVLNALPGSLPGSFVGNGNRQCQLRKRRRSDGQSHSWVITILAPLLWPNWRQHIQSRSRLLYSNTLMRTVSPGLSMWVGSSVLKLRIKGFALFFWIGFVQIASSVFNKPCWFV